jgi:hypothetical protein
LSDINRVNQKGASGEKVIGRDSYEITHNYGKRGHIEELVAILEREMERDERRDGKIESLEFFDERWAPDDVVGLEQKLRKVGRESSIMLALKYKELFAKFLVRYSLYGAAQELIALCLHKVFYEFEQNVHPVCAVLSQDEIDHIVAEKVVAPLLADYVAGSFTINHGLVLGMVYWLADRCYVRWHAA